MATTPRKGKPYIWASWLPPQLSGDKNCTWAVWFKAHFKYAKRPDGSFNLAAWTADHTSAVMKRKAELEALGWVVTLESQNDFMLHGQTAILAGKPDIIAFKGVDVLISDAKTGKQRHSDWWQVLIYMLALPRVRTGFGMGGTIRGEVVYHDQILTVEPEELTKDREREIFALLRKAGAAERPTRCPSKKECDWCDIPATDCPERYDAGQAPVQEMVAKEF